MYRPLSRLLISTFLSPMEDLTVAILLASMEERETLAAARSGEAARRDMVDEVFTGVWG